MIKLNLAAKGTEQELILAYLQENASEVLAKKINNGVSIEKDGKQLVSKKTLDGFMIFAADEARKLAEKGARSACVEDSVVYGWAIHYFEEDSIEGTLYNEDGSEYKPVIKATPKTSVPKPIPKKTNQQTSLFDMLASTEPTKQEAIEEDEDDEEPTPEEVQAVLAEIEMQPNQSVDLETGEIISEQDDDEEEPLPLSSIDKETMCLLYELLDGKMDIQ